MAYIDKLYYDDTFHGKQIPDGEFDRIADAASEVVYDLCFVKPTDDDITKDDFKKAVAYQTEMISEQGGLDALLGFSETAQRASGEHLGDYSVNSGGALQETVFACNGIPVSGMTLMLLKRLGFMTRWAYAGRHHGKP